jgi:hypothetical protein
VPTFNWPDTRVGVTPYTRTNQGTIVRIRGAQPRCGGAENLGCTPWTATCRVHNLSFHSLYFYHHPHKTESSPHLRSKLRYSVR